MHWENIINDRSELQEYRLISQNECNAILKYNPRLQSVRLSIGNNHRLFFLESAGSLSGKTLIKNEYGLEVGHFLQEKFQRKGGYIIINNNKYHYELQKSTLDKLVIYENGLHNPIASCTLPENNFAPSVDTASINHNFFLLGLCWNILINMKQEKLSVSAEMSY